MELYELVGRYIELVSAGNESEARALLRNNSSQLADVLKCCTTAGEVVREEIKRFVSPPVNDNLDQEKAERTQEGAIAVFEAQPPMVASHNDVRVIYPIE